MRLRQRQLRQDGVKLREPVRRLKLLCLEDAAKERFPLLVQEARKPQHAWRVTDRRVAALSLGEPLRDILRGLKIVSWLDVENALIPAPGRFDNQVRPDTAPPLFRQRCVVQ